ncbi:hypothetical protein B0H21DRAFT_762059 [Amylocystis lapponica]|nr:hypothetical protein B0H21DRAFT_762059 [Amylocystis lapponica]
MTEKSAPVTSSSIAGSASIQNRLSAPSSQPRLRTPSHVPDTKSTSLRVLHGFQTDDVSWTTYLSRCLSLALSKEIHSSRQRLGLNVFLWWSLLVYCVLSCVFLSVAIYSKFCGTSAVPVSTIVTPWKLSSLDSLPINHLLSKATMLYPPPVLFDPFVLKASVDPTAVTACLWSTDKDIDSILAWATRWSGPVSLLMTTSAAPSSTEHELLLKRLSALITRRPHLNSTLSVHLLHLEPKTPDNPNAFLNLARLFSQTTHVALFPGNSSTAPPKTLYRMLAAHAPASEHSTAMREPANAPRPRPTVLTTGTQTGFPFSPLAPVVLGRDDALWCTERFSVAECLWQIWLENFGDVEVRQTRGWLHEAQVVASSRQSDLAVVMKLRRRLVTKFRSETCVLATRQLAALRSADKALDAKKARWLKRVCRGWTTAAQQ